MTETENRRKTAQAAVTAAEAAVRQAKANVTAAGAEREAAAVLVRGADVQSNPEVAAARAKLHQAQLDMERTTVRAPVDGIVTKKATSLLGDYYLEIDPGEDTRQMPDGTKQSFYLLGPQCEGYGADDKAKDARCRQVNTVVEATTVDQVMHRFEQTLPNVDRVLETRRAATRP